MFLRNCWYVAAWSSEVGVRTMRSRVILDTPLVLWRKEDGTAVAFDDRCAHRGAPLCKGRLEGDSLRCMYHGLRFDARGACIEVPGQAAIPPGLQVKTYPLVERHQWIWVWMGDPEQADPALVPDTHWLDDPAWASLEGYTHYDTSYLLIADNLLDLAHLPYVHASTLGGTEDYAASPPKIESIARGVRVTRWAMNTQPPAFVQKVRPFAGPVDRWNIYEFVAPGIFSMDSGMCSAGRGRTERQHEDAVHFHSCQALTPETEESAHYFFAQPHDFAIDQPAVTRSIHESVVEAFEEDRAMITAQAANLRMQSDFVMKPIRADEALGKFRWLMGKLVKDEQAGLPTRAEAVHIEPA